MNVQTEPAKGYNHKATAVVYWIFSAIFFITGGGAIVLTCRQIEKNYVPATATVIESRIAEKKNNDIEYGYLYLIYTYKAGNEIQRHRASYWLVKKGTVDYEKLEQTVKSHPKGSVYQIHYNPEKPGKPIFDGIPANAYVPPMGIGILFICIAIGLLLLGFSMYKKPVWVYWARVNKIREGAYELLAAEASGSDMGWKIGFSVIWNLFVVLALVIAYVEKPAMSWQLGLFFSVFIAGGLFLFYKLVIAGYLAARIVKQPKLIIDKMAVKRGDSFEVIYKQGVRMAIPPGSIIISLRCYEEKEVGRAGDTVPMRKTLFEEEKTIPWDRKIFPGSTINFKQQFMIPKNAPAGTAYKTRYQVRWMLEVAITSVSLDFHAQFPLEVV